ncbi:hypothetical protein BaRGS_00040376 [Batillaria attramentaria]|uniref:Uncharacterized protein n=1 Tax=Batillaria attramentaria TaxID=370345 RepID=A0ABD0J0J9_9CAEN
MADDSISTFPASGVRNQPKPPLSVWLSHRPLLFPPQFTCQAGLGVGVGRELSTDSLRSLTSRQKQNEMRYDAPRSTAREKDFGAN